MHEDFRLANDPDAGLEKLVQLAGNEDEYDANYWLTLPVGYNEELAAKNNTFQKLAYHEFSSETKILNQVQIREMLKKGGFL